MKIAKFIKVIAHPLFITLFFAVFFLPFLHHFFPKYQAKVTLSKLIDKQGGYLAWADINNDGESEKIVWFSNTEGKAEYDITKQSDFLFDQQYFNGECLPDRNPIQVYDCNHNNYPEFYIFYHRNDSLFLKVVEHQNKIVTPSKEKFVDKVLNYKGKKDYSVDISQPEDIDNDSIPEIIFSVNAGFPIQPRRIFIYNYVKGSLLKSDFLGTVMGVYKTLDIDMDGKKELLVHQYAPGNMTDSLINGLDDCSVRLIVFNDSLSEEFDPVKFDGSKSQLITIPVIHNEDYYLVTLYQSSNDSVNHATLSVFTNKGEFIARRKIRKEGLRRKYVIIPTKTPESTFQLLDNFGNLTTFDHAIEEKEHKNQPELLCVWPGLVDLDRDGKDEYVFCPGNEQFLVITRNDLSHPVRVNVPHETYYIGFNIKKNKSGIDELSVQYGSKYYLIAYFRNPLHPFRFLIWLMGAGALAGFIYFIQYLQRISLQQKYQTERRMSALQLLLVRNQVSPHFLFNAINSISASIFEKKPEEAHNSIVRLSKLMRSALVSSDQLSRPLKEELEAVTAYVEIVRSQRADPFGFTVDIAGETNTETQIPVMSIQNYTENAIKHGLSTMGGKGQLTIAINQDEKYLRIKIADNGIGREQAAKEKDKPDSSGKGITLMDQFFAEVNKYNQEKITCSITDLQHEDGSSAGTLVELVVPVNMKYRIYD